ncbi:hypothetical protein [Azospirillum argentinense]
MHDASSAGRKPVLSNVVRAVPSGEAGRRIHGVGKSAYGLRPGATIARKDYGTTGCDRFGPFSG